MKSLPQASRKSVPMSTIDRDCADACGGSGDGTTLGAADWLCLAAAPTFAVMALLTGVQSSEQPDAFCSAMHDASPLDGMMPMYLLMAAFHLAPWLKLVSSRRKTSARLPSGGQEAGAAASLPLSHNSRPSDTRFVLAPRPRPSPEHQAWQGRSVLQADLGSGAARVLGA